MSALIGNLKGPNHNSPDDVVAVWASTGGVEIMPLANDASRLVLDPIAARNYAALLVRASEEVERMRVNAERHGRFK